MGKIVILTGQVFGRLTVFERAGTNNHGSALWRCMCTCGNEVDISSQSLREGRTRSCGCLSKEVHTTHGMKHTKPYKTWLNIMDRCYNLNNPDWEDYGGRGITSCPEWRNNFPKFWEDMGSTYKDGLSIDRMDVNGNYCKENCRWTTGGVQSHNRRKRKNCTSSYIGVSLDKQSGKFISQISEKNVDERLGVFVNESDAAIAYDNRSEELYGDRPNKTLRHSK